VHTAVSRRSAIALATGGLLLKAQTPSEERLARAEKMWNEVYARPEPIMNTFPNRFLASAAEGLKPGLALDIGMGQGRNALYLASLGWDVTGVDISQTGIDIAREEAAARKLRLAAIKQEFGEFDLGNDKWDLISEIYIHGLVIDHADRIVKSLRPNGLLIVEGFHRDVNDVGLTGQAIGFKVNELLQAFVTRLRIVHYEEVSDFGDWDESRKKVPLVRMIAKKAL
jgi:SAM-dependent methyltransferase